VDKGDAEAESFAFHQCGPDSILVQGHMWVEFVFGSRLAPSVISKFHLDQDSGPAWKHAKADVASLSDLFYLFLFLEIMLIYSKSLNFFAHFING